MTGFGRCELKSPRGHIRVEIKTINHKFFEIALRLPSHLTEFEEGIRKIILQEIRRGKISLSVVCSESVLSTGRLVLDEVLAKELFQNFQKLRKTLGAPSVFADAHAGNAVLAEIIRYPDVLTREASRETSAFPPVLRKALQSAVHNLKRSRLAEGRALEKDFKNRLIEIQKSLGVIEKRIPALKKEYGRNLETRMKEFLKEGQVDRERLTLEVALYMKNTDISEEITRMKSHVDAMRKTLREAGELGRKIDFLGQEMIREANTMGSKSSDIVIAERVIAIKSGIEKIREQSQNVE